jgi:hypothetical protein
MATLLELLFFFILIFCYIKNIADEIWAFLFFCLWLAHILIAVDIKKISNKLIVLLFLWLIVSMYLSFQSVTRSNFDTFIEEFNKNIFRPYIYLLPFLVFYIYIFIKKYLSKDRA